MYALRVVLWFSCMLVLGGDFVSPATVVAADLSARDIMEKNFFVMKVPTIKNSARMSLITEEGSVRERKMDIVGKLQKNGIDSNLIIRFQYPPDIKGTSFLQIEHSDGDDNLWIYLPALNKSRRLVANNKKDSFFGSDFSYGDILPPKVDLYHHKLSRLETLEGHACYVVESVPKDEKEKHDSGYSKKISWIRNDNFVESKIEYYDTDGSPLKTQTVTQHQLVDPKNRRWIALRREIVNQQTGHKTVLVFDKVEVGMSIADDFFTTSTLERVWHR